jgi:flagellar hook-associated protein 3 FlgL
MSGALANIYNNLNYALSLHSKAITHLQEQASTGARVNRVSDDPSAAYNILGLNSQERFLTSYMDTLSEAVSTLEVSTSVIEDAISDFTEVKKLLTQVASGTYQEDGRQRVAEQVNNILEQIVSLANTKHMHQYVFGGTNTASAPYVAQRQDGNITRVTYQGSSENRNVEVAPGLESSAFYVGDKIFRLDSRGAPLFLGRTGARCGAGTANVSGTVWLTVIHDGTNYKLSIDDGQTYVTVPPGGDTNQAVTDSRTGQVLYVDSTQINSTGVETVCIPGTDDIFSILIGIRDVLQNERQLPEDQLRDLLRNSLDSIEQIDNLLLQAGISVGSRIGFLSSLKDSLESRRYDTRDEVTRLQEADIAQVAIDLSRRQVLYEMSLSVAGKLMSLSLLDFIE